MEGAFRSVGASVLALGMFGGVAAAGPRSVTLTGTRTVVVTGTLWSGVAAGTYAVQEIDSGREVRAISYAAPATMPTMGIQPIGETIRAEFGRDPAGAPVVVNASDTLTGIDRGAHQAFSVDDVRTETIVYRGSVAAEERIVETGRGAIGASFASIDLTRVTNADGSFDEDGSISVNEQHILHVRGDFSASSHD